jgi:UDP-N-acetylglucosamine--N-acetylmuramyl-(pentapeptide) pyrophosphoryl-undecaprenol N-acetylglucosamine transferase
LPERVRTAHLVICRSGASTVSELAVIGRPAVLIPYPYATDDHQTANAGVLANAGAAWLVQQREVKPETLSLLLQQIFTDPVELARRAELTASLGKSDAAQRLADLVDSIGGGLS